MEKFWKFGLLFGGLTFSSSYIASGCMPVVDINGKACCTLSQKQVNQKLKNISELQHSLPNLAEKESDFFVKSSIKNTVNVLKLSKDSINMTSAIYDLYNSLEKISKKGNLSQLCNQLLNQCAEILK